MPPLQGQGTLTFHHLIFTGTEHVRVARGHSQAANAIDVARESELQGARGQVPNLDGAVAGARGKPLIARLHSNAAHPTQVP